MKLVLGMHSAGCRTIRWIRIRSILMYLFGVFMCVCVWLSAVRAIGNVESQIGWGNSEKMFCCWTDWKFDTLPRHTQRTQYSTFPAMLNVWSLLFSPEWKRSMGRGPNEWLYGHWMVFGDFRGLEMHIWQWSGLLNGFHSRQKSQMNGMTL